MGFVTFWKAEGKVMKKLKAGRSIPDKTREGLSVEVITQKEAQEQVQVREIAKTILIVDPIKCNFDPKINPTQPAHHQVALHYKDKLSNQKTL